MKLITCVNGDGRPIAPELRGFVNEVKLCQECYDNFIERWVKDLNQREVDMILFDGEKDEMKREELTPVTDSKSGTIIAWVPKRKWYRRLYDWVMRKKYVP